MTGASHHGDPSYRVSGAQIGWAIGMFVALYPSALPRTWTADLILMLAVGGIGAAIGAIGTRVRRRLRNLRHDDARPDEQNRDQNADRFPERALFWGLALIVAAHLAWQVWLRSTFAPGAVPGIEALHLLLVPVVALLPVRPTRRASPVPSPRRVRGPRTPARRVALGTLGALVAAGALSPAAADPNPPVPVSRTSGPLANQSTSTTHIRIGFADAPTASGRAELAATELRKALRPDTNAVVLAFPTGSGWVDGTFVSEFGRLTGGNGIVVSVGYDDRPSWVSFVTGTEPVTDAATATIQELAPLLRVPGTPPVYLYGESLGAIGADRARRAAAELSMPIANTLLVGAPDDAVSADGPGRVTILDNPTDPVPRWQPRLALAPTDGIVSDHKVPWLPGVSFLQTSADLISSRSFKTGIGHRYGSEQAVALLKIE